MPAAWRVGLTAVRPFAYPASMAGVAIGVSIAGYLGFPLRAGPLAMTVLGVLCFHTGANLLNDAFDHRRGLDTQVQPNSGAVVRGWLSEARAIAIAAGLLILGAVCGLLLARDAGGMIGWLGLIGAVCAIGYTTPGFCFKYAGAGDAVIGVAFGLLVVLGAFWVQAHRFDWLPVLWSVPHGLLAVAILHANNWRDRDRDRLRQCRTVAGRLGPRGSRVYSRALVLGPFVLAALYLLLGRGFRWGRSTPASTLLVFLALPMAWRLARIRPDRDPQAFAALDAATARLHLLFGILSAGAFWLGGGRPMAW